MKSLFAALFLGLVATPALATINEVDVDYNDGFQQTAAATVNYTGSFYSARLDMATAADYASAIMNYGAGSSQTLTPQSPGSTTLIYQTGLYPSEAAMFADFPTGLYQFSAGSDAAALTVDATPFAAVPQFTNFSALSSINPNQAFDFQITGFSPNPDANDSLTFLTIYDYTTGTFVYDASFNPPGTTDFVVSANTLTAGHSYSAEAIYSSRIDGYDIDNNVYTTQLFDNRTDVAFTVAAAAAPEPAVWAMMLAGFGGLGAVLRRRRAMVGMAPV